MGRWARASCQALRPKILSEYFTLGAAEPWAARCVVVSDRAIVGSRRIQAARNCVPCASRRSMRWHWRTLSLIPQFATRCCARSFPLHSRSEYLKTPGGFCKSSARRCACSPVSAAGRPPAWCLRKPSMPCRSSACTQRSTVRGCLPNHRATSQQLRPSAISSMQCSRCRNCGSQFILIEACITSRIACALLRVSLAKRQPPSPIDSRTAGIRQAFCRACWGSGSGTAVACEDGSKGTDRVRSQYRRCLSRFATDGTMPMGISEKQDYWLGVQWWLTWLTLLIRSRFFLIKEPVVSKMINSDVMNAAARSDGSVRHTINFTEDFCRRSRPTLLISLLLLWTGPANASVIFDNGVTTPTIFPTSDVSNNSQFNGYQVLADDFTLPEPTNITDVHWTGSYFGSSSPVPDAFTIQICTGLSTSASSGVCAPLTFSTPVSRMPVSTWFEYWVDVNPYLVGPGIHWITIYNNTAADPITDWLWGSNLGGNAFQILNQTGGTFSQADLAGPWQEININMDFRLTSVPEPGSLALLGLGLAALRFGRRKQAG